MQEIRVPSKVVRTWRDETGWYCALEDGRVYQAHQVQIRPADSPPNKWVLLVGAVEGR